MRCPACDYEAPEGMRFCGNCGQALAQICPGCKGENPPEHKFCGGCGSSLGGATPAPAEPAERKPAPRRDDADRRQITVMFCDLVGSTALSESLDPEDLREVVRSYQRAAGQVIQALGGHTAQHLGDGLLVYFGYPKAMEHAPQRAVAAGLGIVDALDELNETLERERGIRLSVRIGIHTGLVVAGEVGTGQSQERLAMGRTPNVAARLEGLAEPDTVVLTGATHRLVRSQFHCDSLGQHELKGVAGAVEVFRAVSASSSQPVTRPGRDKGTDALIGRDVEAALLLDRLARVRSGRGEVVLVNGEPGIGKSRLVQMLEQRAREEDFHVPSASCSPLHQNTAFYPIRELLTRMFGIGEETTPEERTGTVLRSLSDMELTDAVIQRAVLSLLALPIPEGGPVPEASPQLQREAAMRGMVELLRRFAIRQPVLLIVEDLHWADPSTVELIDRLLEDLPGIASLALLTCRPSFRPTWKGQRFVTQITLTPLSEQHVNELARTVIGEKKLPDEVLRLVVEKTDGVPLFVEEMARMILDSGWVLEEEDRYVLTRPLRDVDVPQTLQDLLMARLDRTSEARETAQLAAVLGRTFDLQLLRLVSGLQEDELRRHLQLLVHADLIHPAGAGATYSFRHALIQDTAYEMLLKRSRQRHHRRVSEVLEEHFPTLIEAQPELAAFHCARGGRPDQAIAYWESAARSALLRSENQEAMRHVEDGLGTLGTLARTAERDRKELDLRALLAPALMAAKGWASQELEETLNRSLSLVNALGEGTYAFPILWGIWSYYQLRGRFDEALPMAERNLEIAEESGDPGTIMEGLVSVADSQWYLGRHQESADLFEQAESLYDREKHSDHAYVYGLDPLLFAKCHRGLATWRLGDPERAEQLLREARSWARELSHANSTGMVQMFSGLLSQYQEDADAVAQWAEDLLTLCERHGLFQWTALGMMLRGWAGVARGEDTLEMLRQGISMYESSGARMATTHHRYLQAEAWLSMGRTSDAIDEIDQGLLEAESLAESFCLPELLKLKGDCLLKLSDPDPAAAEEAYRESLRVAMEQGSRLPRLRVATALCRLLSGGSAAAEGIELLSAACADYPGDPAAKDIKTASELLARAGAGGGQAT